MLCRCRERDFLKKIHECMEREGKVTMVTTCDDCKQALHFKVQLQLSSY